MVTCKLINSRSSGLFCNKLFLGAATIALAHRNGDEAVFPVHSNTTWLYGHVFENTIKTSNILPVRCEWKEPNFTYDEIPYQKDINLTGYFQSEKYFRDCGELIRHHYEPRIDIANKIRTKYADVLNNAVSIHVRRGDYLLYPDKHPVCDMNYYNKAMEIFDGATFIICSNDMEWCKNNFKGKNIVFSDGDEVEDLFLQSFCQHNIIANSSFSWWGAWLNENKNKVVVAPKKWFGPNYFSSRDLCPDEWIKI